MNYRGLRGTQVTLVVAPLGVPVLRLLGDVRWQNWSSSFFPPHYLRRPPVLLLLICGRLMWEVEQAPSDRLVALASQGGGPIDGRLNNAPNGVHVNTIKGCHAQ